MAGISVWQLAIVAVIIALLFGTKRLRGLGGDLGTTIKGFKQAMAEDKDVAANATSAGELNSKDSKLES